MIAIRHATRDDATAILDFQMRLALETENISLDKLIASKGIAAVFDEPSKGNYYVAEHRGQLVGCFLITYEWSDWRNANIWWLQSVYVDISHRRSGVFKHMYDHILNMISNDAAVAGLRLYVDKSNGRAQKVYQSMGMDGDHYTVFEKMRQK